MTGLGLVGGVAAVNGVLLASGYGMLAPALRGLPPRLWLSYAGLALLVGAAAAGVLLCAAAVAGLHTGPEVLFAAAAAAGTVGIVTALARGPILTAGPRRAPPPSSRSGRLVSIVSGFALAAVGTFALVGGFRASPWLDDVWSMWLPKGIALDRLGVDARLFLPGATYVPFPHLDYPWWWSVLLGDDVHAVGSVDMRAVNAQLTVLTVAFFGAVLRLLWGYVRPELLLPALLLVAASPELLRQVQGGGADVPLALYLVLFAIAASGWLHEGRPFWLALAALAGAAALQIKTEGLPQLLLFAVLATLFGLRAGRARLGGLWLAVALAFVSAAPFLIWRRAHGLRNDVNYGSALDPNFLLGRTGRVPTAAGTLAHDVLTPRNWLLLVPLALAFGVLAARRHRDIRWLAPAALAVVVFLFWVWVNWADSFDLQYRLSTSGQRIVDALVLVAGVSVPVLAEGLRAPRAPD